MSSRNFRNQAHRETDWTWFVIFIGWLVVGIALFCNLGNWPF